MVGGRSHLRMMTRHMLTNNSLPNKVVFGKVTNGMDVVKQIGFKGSEVGRPLAEVRQRIRAFSCLRMF